MSLMATHVAHIITLHAACGDLSESASDDFFFFCEGNTSALKFTLYPAKK